MMHFPLFPRSLRTLLVLASLAVANPFTDTFDANSLLGWTVVGQRSWSAQTILAKVGRSLVSTFMENGNQII